MTFPPWSVAPFFVMLVAIAAAPLIPRARHLWDRPRHQLMASLILGGPVAVGTVFAGRGDLVIDSAFEYAQFMTLLFALFVVSGGIFLRGDLAATPRTNTIFLAVGGVLASFIGTTGAAMLLIRPILVTNSQRKYRVHTVVFCIFIIANCGGMLTPLGDPPLFLGMLRGVPFTWTFHLAPEWLFVNGILLVTYWSLDRRFHRRERRTDIESDWRERTPLRLEGATTLLWFAAIVLAVAFLPSVDAHRLTAGNLDGWGWIPWRELVMLGAAAGSYFLGSKRIRFTDNAFTFRPIAEVAAIFVGIFLTMIPALQVLRDIAPRLPLGEVTFFVFTGGLSSILDNAPTYLTFFEMGRTIPGPVTVAGVPEPLLVAISLGAVFCGALTYIGNGPNFMVKSVAEEYGVAMPSFSGYTAHALRYVGPVLVALVLIFIADAPWSTATGIGIAALLLTWYAARGIAARQPSASPHR